MVRLFVRHPVTDYSTWREHYDGFDAERRDMGVTDHGVFQSVADPNDVTVWHDFQSRADAEAFVGAPRLREVMEEAGVAGSPEVWVATKS